MDGKWMVTMKRNEETNRAVVNAHNEYSALFEAEAIHSHKGWRAVSATPAAKMTQSEVERMFLEEQMRDSEFEAFLRITN